MENAHSLGTYKALAVIHNNFINGQYQMSRYELRIFIAMLEMLDKDDKEFQTLIIPVSEIFPPSEYRSGQIYEEVKKACEKLALQVIKIERTQPENSSVRIKGRVRARRNPDPVNMPERKFTILPLMALAQYQEGNGYVEVEFNEKVKPFLLQLKENFTKTEINELLKLKNTYSFKLYWLLKQYLYFGKRTFSIEDFRFQLSVEDKYKKFVELVRWIIEPALQDINTTDIEVTFEERREANRVVSIDFFIKSKNEKSISPPTNQRLTRNSTITNNAESDGRQQEKVPTEIVLQRLDLSDSQIEAILGSFSPEQIYKIAFRINLHLNDNRGVNRAAYAYTQFQNALRFQ